MRKIDQSFRNLKLVFSALKESVSTPPVENRDFAGIVQSFEFTYELTWKTLKIYLEQQGISAPFPRVCLEEALKRGFCTGMKCGKRSLKIEIYQRIPTINL
ncbi:MAG: nucleotidyltransferase substrate binding protein [Proteobacteria bacterium]|nr:nucleotidyltransferase substrate binding protein [Pseudomonadota bacterium]